MKSNKAIWILIILLGFGGRLYAQSRVIDNLSLESKILKGERKYAIYLPPDYETSERTYPILYLLHGLGDDQAAWIQFGEVKRIADEAIKSGKATPMIIVMPDAKTGRSGYFNWIKKDEWNYEDFFIEELIPYVEKKYRIKKSKRYRALSGNSMGGGGSFIYAMHHPELFGSACPLSAWFWWSDFDAFKKKFAKDDLEIGDEKLMQYYKENHPLELVKSVPKDDLNSVKWYIDCGDGDSFSKGNCLMHIEMKKAGIKHEYRVRNGNHNWGYWRESLPSVLNFVSDGFHK